MKIVPENNPNAISLACQMLRQGEVISFATDTVYGFAVDASNEKAVEKLYALKNRDAKKPVAIFVKDISDAKKIFHFEDSAKKIAEKFLPGALTLVLQQNNSDFCQIAKNLNREAENFLGFRIVNRDFIMKLMAEFSGILAVTSANLSGAEPANNSAQIEKYFANSNLSLIVDGGELSSKAVSTVVKVIDNKIEILRHGAISELLIKQVLGL